MSQLLQQKICQQLVLQFSLIEKFDHCLKMNRYYHMLCIFTYFISNNSTNFYLQFIRLSFKIIFHFPISSIKVLKISNKTKLKILLRFINIISIENYVSEKYFTITNISNEK